MKTYQLVKLDQLAKELRILSDDQYSGKLDIKNSQGMTWSFYYYLGEIIWVTGGIHPYRRWLRNIAQNCPQIDMNSLKYHAEDILIDYWDYLILENLYRTLKIDHHQINKIVLSTIKEVLFDIVQELNIAPVSCQLNQEWVLKSLLPSTDGNILLQQMQEFWIQWTQAGLTNISPHLSPIIRKPEVLSRQVSPIIYKNLEKLLNGKYALWDLSVRMKRNLLAVCELLLPFIQNRVVECIKVDDISLPKNYRREFSVAGKAKKGSSPLIACVDDSIQTCQTMEKIITAHQMRFLGLQDSVQALPMLLQNQPDLIFLDLLMPIMSGYELCSQLRRISLFSNTPIVILTASDGVFDRVRSKVFGATEFMNKPIIDDHLIEVINRYLNKGINKENINNNIVFSY